MLTKQSIEIEFVEDRERSTVHAVAKVTLEIRTEDMKYFSSPSEEDRLTLRIVALKELQKIRLKKF